MSRGYLAVILHGHLPFIRHPEHEDFLEERWLYEAITESYIPLLWTLEGLAEDSVDYRLTLVLTPTLVSMLSDPLLRSRYRSHLDRLCELSEKETVRTRDLPEFHGTAIMYRERFHRARDDFEDKWGSDLIAAFLRLQNAGRIEIITSCATHGFLPLLRMNPAAVRAQIFTGINCYQEVFGREPRGFWLPECAYYPGLDEILQKAGIRYFVVDSHAFQGCTSGSAFGVYAPIYSPGGVAAFGRDPESSKQVWSSVEGYPGDYDYREFYRDIGHDLDFDYVRPYVHVDGIRIDTGLKYYKITDHTNFKEPYVRFRALKKAEQHATDFLWKRAHQTEQIFPHTHRPPIIVAPYDAELFGHWWFEGPDWLEHVLRRVSRDERLKTICPSDYLNEFPVNPCDLPAASSWGQGGFNSLWLNETNDWIYPHLHAAAGRMIEFAEQYSSANGLVRRALNQAGRELLLAQSSDWAFIMARRTAVQYAEKRTKDHLLRFHHLCDMVRCGSIDREGLSEIESRDNLFPNFDYTVYREDYRLPWK
jgi:1,4-alpha-glucan branching enzyme